MLYFFFVCKSTLYYMMKGVILQPYKISVSSNRGECLVSQSLLSGLLLNQDVEACLSALGWRYDCAPPLPLLYPSFHYPSTRHEDRMRTQLSQRLCVQCSLQTQFLQPRMYIKNWMAKSEFVFYKTL